jgi:DNA modification methylase
MKPYYEESGITIYHGDCREIAPGLAFDGLVLTDPPYGINHPTNYKARGRSVLTESRDYIPVHGDNESFDPRWLLQLGTDRIIWGGNYFANLLPPVSGWLVWDKERPDELDQATCELAWTDCVKGVRRYRYLWNGMIRAGDDVLMHPTQKPEALMTWCLSLRWTKGFKSIIDPYMGSGTALVAAKRSGLTAIGIEREESYCEIASNRLRQGVLFGSQVE